MESRTPSLFPPTVKGIPNTVQGPFPEDEMARRHYILLGIFFGIVMQTAYGVSNLYQGIWAEAALDFFVATLFGVAVGLVYQKKNVEIAYRFTTMGAALIASYTIFFNEHDVYGTILGVMPVPLVVFYLLGIKEGLMWVLPMSVLPILLSVFPWWFSDAPAPSGYSLHMVVVYLIIVFFGGMAEWTRRRTWTSLYQANKFLKRATEQHTTLQGLVPLCSYCKRTRDDNGYWRNLEMFLKENTNAIVSSGLCDKCAENQTSPPKEESELLPQTDYIQAFIRANDDIRRLFVVFGSALSVLVLSYFVVRYIGRGELLAAAINFGVALFTGIAGILVWKHKYVSIICRLLIVGFMGVLLAPFIEPEPEVMEILWFFVFPLITFHLIGFRNGAIAISIVVVALVAVLINLLSTGAAQVSTEFLLYFSLSLSFMILLTAIVEHLRHKYSRMVEERVEAMQKTYAKIRTLKGAVPVCASCKAVRNDKGFWTNVESLLLEKTELMFSHSICERCLKEQMPELYYDMVQAGEIHEK